MSILNKIVNQLKKLEAHQQTIDEFEAKHSEILDEPRKSWIKRETDSTTAQIRLLKDAGDLQFYETQKPEFKNSLSWYHDPQRWIDYEAHTGKLKSVTANELLEEDEEVGRLYPNLKQRVLMNVMDLEDMRVKVMSTGQETLKKIVAAYEIAEAKFKTEQMIQRQATAARRFKKSKQNVRFRA